MANFLKFLSLLGLLLSLALSDVNSAYTSDDGSSPYWSPSSPSDSGGDPYPPRNAARPPKNEYHAIPLSPRRDANGRIISSRSDVSYVGLYQGSGTGTSGYRGDLPGRRGGDVIGHATPARFGGSGTDPVNTFAQNGRVNNGDWKRQENALHRQVSQMDENQRRFTLTHKRQYGSDSENERPTRTRIKAESPGGTKFYQSPWVDNPVESPPRSRSLSPGASSSSGSGGRGRASSLGSIFSSSSRGSGSGRRGRG